MQFKFFQGQSKLPGEQSVTKACLKGPNMNVAIQYSKSAKSDISIFVLAAKNHYNAKYNQFQKRTNIDIWKVILKKKFLLCAIEKKICVRSIFAEHSQKQRQLYTSS